MCTIVHYFCAETTDADVFGHGGKDKQTSQVCLRWPWQPRKPRQPWLGEKSRDYANFSGAILNEYANTRWHIN